MSEETRWPTPTASLMECQDPVGWMKRAVRQKAKHGKNTGSGAGLNIGAAVVFQELGLQKPNETLYQMSERVLQELWPTPRVSGRGTVEFVRADGKLRDDLETTTFMGAMWPTPTVQDGCNTAGASQFARNTLPLNSEVFRDEVSKLTADQIRSVIGDRRLNARWVEQLMGWPVGWCDLDDDMPLTLPAPAGRHAEQYDHEAPRITSMPLRSAAAKKNNAALRQLGNGQVPACAATAFNLLMKHL